METANIKYQRSVVRRSHLGTGYTHSSSWPLSCLHHLFFVIHHLFDDLMIPRKCDKTVYNSLSKDKEKRKKKKGKKKVFGIAASP
ncbi:MAG: hypothetical protein PHP50_04610 [Lachnospiraceae bacterium]|nr:hypothetical protein [Lachnospiraceae bacterium]